MAWVAATTVLTWVRLLLLLVVSTGQAEGSTCGYSFTASSGTITSPNYPNQYYNNAYCGWSITVGVGRVISLRFTDFHLERNWDYVKVYDGRNTGATLLGQYTGESQSISVIRSTGNYMYILFTSDGSVLKKGFRATYDSQYYCRHQSYTASSGSITSPSYPNEYFDNAACSYSITVGTGRLISLRFTDFHLEQGYDYVRVYDGRNNRATLLGQYTGESQSIDVLQSTGNAMYIVFTTDHSIVKKGFRATYSSHYCSQSLTASSGTITSPGYPNQYYNNADCSWSITASQGHVISLRFSDFQLERGYDYVKVYDGSNKLATLLAQYTGELQSNVIRSTGNTMYIVFTSDGSVLRKGFRGTYVSHYCQEFHYGEQNCNTRCPCERSNTVYCNNINGTCLCKDGWTGNTCTVNVNECLGTNVDLCPENSNCVDTVGSYTCVCSPGYVFNVATRECDVRNECSAKQCSHSCIITDREEEQCVCPADLVIDRAENLTCVVPYYPYGTMYGDHNVQSEGEEEIYNFVSAPIKFSPGVPFGTKEQSFASVRTSGVISFGERPVPLQPDLKDAVSSRQNIIVPFWALMSKDKGRTYYQLYEKWSEAGSTSSSKDMVMKRAKEDIIKFYNLHGFEVNTVLLATWDAVEPLGSQGDEQNTFQGIYVSGWKKDMKFGREILSDEQTGYVIFLYQKGMMKWKHVEGRIVEVGTTHSGQIQTRTEMLGDLAGNTGYNGVLTFEIGRVGGDRQKCHKYVSSHAELLSDPAYEAERNGLYNCPCTLERLGRQWQLFEIRGENRDIYCYAISILAKRRLLQGNTRNKLCCYKWVRPATQSWYVWTWWIDWILAWRQAPFVNGHVLIGDPWYFWWQRNNNVGYLQARENIQAQQWCCSDVYSTELCERFYSIFPRQECTNHVTFVTGAALGDPHITTLDGLTYTMNGLGEYFMLDIPTENFTLQARTGRAESSNGTLTNATVFTAFAARESNYSTFQVELSTTNTTMVIIADGIDLTSEFYDDFEFERTTETISVARQFNQNKTVVVATFPCGVTMKASVGVKSLLIEFELDETLQNKTTGLLGNFNGNMDDEFTLPNGTVLASNISDREIFYHFGRSWEVTAENSVFTYEAGVNASDYQHPDFVPMFRDEADPEAVAEAEEVCGTENDACIFDYLVTGDTAFAEDTKLSKENYDVQRINLENNPPTIEMRSDNVNNSNQLIIHNGTETKIDYVIDDADDNDTVQLEFITNSNIASVDESGTITTVTFGPYVYDGSHALEMFGVRAVDSKGGSSQVIYTPVFLCTGCSRHGQCINTTVRERKPEDSFFKLACNCLPAYTGDDCESEVDACESKPCFQGQSCTDLTAAEQGNSSIGYTCGPCPAGFTEQNGQCIDIDECSTNNTCEQMCTNTEGSYSCGCHEGYRLDPEDRHNCSDIDECGENLHNCEGYCDNEPGNYSCRCWDDYILGDDGHTCIQNFSTGHVCLQKKCDQKCEAVDGQATCDCANGYEKDPENETKCLDVNECELDNMPCSQVCNNTVGSHSCSCYPGYTLDVDRVSCSLCKVPYYGENCANICQCSGHGTCDPIRGCVCDDAWTGTNCEADVDECTNSSACPSGHPCENEIGSYSCLCSEGYQKTDTGTCEDINECTSLEANMTCDLNIETCENTIGSYRCLCKNGYVPDKSVCTDINECASGDHECEQVCENVPGSYKCSCNPGYKLAADRRSCVQIKNFCLNSQLNCSHICSVNASGHLYCACPRGYQLIGSTICEDVDLCATASCSDGCVETNENRSFQCVCRPGRQLEEDLITCSDCPDGKWGMECLNQCQCVETNTDSCNKANGSCTCKTGWKGDTCSVEIDVCEEVTCQEHSFCNKTDGGHVCICDDGYFSLGSLTKCEECEAFKFGYNCSQSCKCNRTTTDYCNVTDGSCVCNSGWEGQDCSQDVDECVDDDACTDHSTCHNEDGSYTCLCIQGFSWVEKSRICQDVDECASSPCEQTCTNYVGSFECSCEPGYTFNETNSNMCQDVDECSSSPCEQICTNSEGSFECSCQPGYTVNETDSNMCQECEAFKFGYNCSHSCECNRTTTDYCNATDGSCVCNSGWEGQDCSQDVDECVEDDACPDHSTCHNEDGSYTCLCDQGYSWVEDSRICQDVDECSSSPCEQICTNSEGSFECSCQPGYTVDETNSNMCQDVNECSSSPCEQICTNNMGSFECSCETGYAVDDTNSNMCQDVDECSSRPCEQICTNNVGSFECSCDSGYIIDETNSQMCQDVNECSSSPCEQICTNNKGSFECSCEPGYAVDDTNSNICQDVDECSSSPCEQICTNSEGSFECSCEPGYIVDETNSDMCQDVDECSSSPCEQICTNNVGSFECSCDSGYIIDETNSDLCQDVDECADDENSPCEQNCTNTDGSFDCSCRTGFMKNQADPSQCFETSVYNMTLVFGYEETVDFSNVNTDDYRNIKSAIEQMVKTKLEKRGLPVVAVNVISLRKGSVDATLEVVMNKEEEQDASNNTDAFTDAMMEMMHEDSPTINGTASPLKQFSVNDQEYSDTDTPCDTRQKRNPCAESEICVEGEDRETLCKAAEDSNETDLILALALGIPCLLILCALITVLVYCNAKDQNKKEAEPSPQASENMSYKLDRDFAVDKGGKFGSSNPFYFESKYLGSDKHGSLWRQGHGLPEGVSRNPRPDCD